MKTCRPALAVPNLKFKSIDTDMIRPGLVSITFRQLDPAAVIELARESKIEGIEWGGDVHVPHGDYANARRIGDMTRDAGLNPYAYGSYYRIGKSESEGLGFELVRDTARELGAQTIRVWAGTKEAEEADSAYRDYIASELDRIAELALGAGMTVSLEFHSRTLNNTASSCCDLIEATRSSAVGTLWQPPVGMADEPCRESLRQVLPYLHHLHVFHWDSTKRWPLVDGAERWRQFFDIARSTQRDLYAALEFVQGDSPEQFRSDALALHRMLGH
jgi:sugar phosphate isomerase/epimerase